MLHRVSIGRDGLVTTRLGFGTGGLLRVPTRRERHNVLAAAFASGIRHFDTAPVYGLGESERALGELLRGRRSSVTVTTKFGLRVSSATARLAGLQSLARRLISLAPGLRARLGKRSAALYAAPDFSIEAVRASLEQSLRSLGTDYVDLYLAHECSDEALPGDELIDILERLRQEGRIREFGTAASFERTRGVLPLKPALANVCQFESGRVAEIRALGGKRYITHGAMARAGDADPHALLRAAMLENQNGVVLMHSRSVARIEANVRAVS